MDKTYVTVTSDHTSDAPEKVTIQVTSVDREALGELVVAENMRALVRRIQVAQSASQKGRADNARVSPPGVVQTLKTLDALAEPHRVPRITSVDHKAIGDLIANNAIARVVGVEKTSQPSPVIETQKVDLIAPCDGEAISASERVQDLDDGKPSPLVSDVSVSHDATKDDALPVLEQSEVVPTLQPEPQPAAGSPPDESSSEGSQVQDVHNVQEKAPVPDHEAPKVPVNRGVDAIAGNTPAFAGSANVLADESAAPEPKPALIPATDRAPAKTSPLRDMSEYIRQRIPQSRHPYVVWAYRIGKWATFAFAGWFLVMTALIVLYRFVDPPLSSLMMQHLARGKEVRQTWRSLDEISPNLVKAVIVSEDWRFCQHRGIDIAEIRAAIRRSRNGIPRGASTMSMQVAKNLFLWPSKSYIRKALEVPLTLTMELVWPKWRMAEIYLNIVEWGPGRFGAHEAARYHFKRPASRLSSRQAALLAVSLPNPIKRRAGRPGPGLRRLASVIQGRMKIAGSATKCVLRR